MGFDFLDFGFPKSGIDWKSLNGKPFITISAKGRSNGLSTKINDGADFGPDTTLNATSPSQIGPPYTQTSGIQEAYNSAPFESLIGLSTNPHNTYTIQTEIQFNTKSVAIIALGRVNAFIEPSSNFSGSYLFNLGGASYDFEGIVFQAGNSSVGYFENSNAIIEDIVFDYHWHNCYFGASPFNAFNFNNVGPISRYEFFDTQFALSGGTGGNFGLNGGGNSIPLIFVGCDFSVPYGSYLFNLGAISPYVVASYAHIGGDGTTNEAVFNITNSTDCLYFNVFGLNLMDTYTYLFNAQAVTNVGRIQMATIYGIQSPNLFLGSVINGLFIQLKTDQLNTNPYLGITGFVVSSPPSLQANPPVSGTVYQNKNSYDIIIKVPVTYNPTSSAAATLATGISSTSTVTTSTKVSIPSGLKAADGQILTYEMRVPAWWYYELVATNATIGTAEIYAT